MAQQLNYHPSENISQPHLAINTSWSLTGNFDYENVKMNRLAYDGIRLVPPKQGQLFPVNVPLHTQ